MWHWFGESGAKNDEKICFGRRARNSTVPKYSGLLGLQLIMTEVDRLCTGTVYIHDRRYIDGAGWFELAAQSAATFYVLPAVITLLGSYMGLPGGTGGYLKISAAHSRRWSETDTCQNDTCLCVQRSDLPFYFLQITFLVEAVLHLEAFSVGLVLENLKIYFLDGVGVFFAISPIIAPGSADEKGNETWLWYLRNIFVCWIICEYVQTVQRWYIPWQPFSAISGYYNANMFQVLIGVVILMVCVILSLLILKGLNRKTK